MTARKSLTKGRAKYNTGRHNTRKSKKCPTPSSPPNPKIRNASRSTSTPAGTTSGFTIPAVTPATALKAGVDPHTTGAAELPVEQDSPDEPSLLVQTRREAGRLLQKGMEKISDLLPDSDSVESRNESGTTNTKHPNVDDEWAQSPEDVNGVITTPFRIYSMIYGLGGTIYVLETTEIIKVRLRSLDGEMGHI